MESDGREADGGEKALEKHAVAILNAIRSAKIGVCITKEIDGLPHNVVVNDAAVEILGHPREVLLAHSAFEFIEKEEHARMQTLRARHLGTGIRDALNETVIRRADGTTVPIAYALSTMTIDGERAHVSLCWDISKRRMAEDKLLAEEARLRQVIESAPDGIVISRNGIILEANPAAASMLGFEAKEQLVGVSLYSLMSTGDTRTMKDRVVAGQQGAKLSPHIYQAKRTDGSHVVAEITSVPYEFNGEHAVMGFARDITDRARLQQQLAQTERLASIGTLAAGVAHEINNPLTVMTLGLEALGLRVKKSSSRIEERAYADMLEIIEELRGGVERVASIVRELKNFSRSDNESVGPTDIVTVLASAIRLTAHQIRHRARLSTEYGEVDLVIGDPRRLEQVFINLLMNAAQAMPEGNSENRIDVRTYRAPDGRVGIDVRDNGIGISEENLKRIFDPFFTTKAVGEGTGLGLSITHEIIKRFGGDITFESERGKGTTVCVLLPISADQHSSAETHEAPPSERNEPRARILIVDDEASLLSSLRMLLNDDHDVTTVTNGDAASALLLHGSAFDVVLCDVMMPGVSGIDLHARVSAERPELVRRIVFMTGGACTDSAKEFLKTVPNRVLQKPFGIAEVEEIVHEFRTLP